MDNNSIKKIFLVTFLVCIVCSILVAFSAVFLKKEQDANKNLDMEKNIIEVSGLIAENQTHSTEKIIKIYNQYVIPKLVNIRTGKLYAGEDIDIKNYDGIKASKDPTQSIKLSSDQDIASIKSQEKYAKIYLVKDNQNKIKTIILPVRGYGLWSTLYGFLALKNDSNTIQGLTFYDQKETPGLGGEVDNPTWKAQWKDKQIKDVYGNLKIKVVKNSSSSTIEDRKYQIDAISGASLTSRGVNNLIHFWLGPLGFGPFLENFKNSEIKL